MRAEQSKNLWSRVAAARQIQESEERIDRQALTPRMAISQGVGDAHEFVLGIAEDAADAGILQALDRGVGVLGRVVPESRDAGPLLGFVVPLAVTFITLAIVSTPPR